MVIYYFYTKVSKNKQTVMNHLNNVNQEDKYKNRDDLICKEVQNLPNDFENIQEFWKTAVEKEQVKTDTFREYEVSLPLEFSNDLNKKIGQEFFKNEFGNICI